MPVKKKSPAPRSTKSKLSVSKAKKPATSKRATSSESTQAKPTKSKSKSKAPKDELTLDRRHEDRRDEQPGETVETQAAPALERRKKVQRRRQIDPTTCERDYSPVEVEFMSAMDDYKRKSGRMFPTCSEVLEVIGLLGYVKLTSADLAARTPEEAMSQETEPGEAVEQASLEEEATGWPEMETADSAIATTNEFAV